MSNHTDVSKFLQAVFPDYAASAIFAHSLTTGGMAHTRNPGSLFGSRDCYWSIAAFPDDGTAVRTLARALEVRCLVIDDVGTKVSDGAVLAALGAPTAIVETSSGNFQWVYRLATPVAVSDWAEFFREVEALVGQRLEGRDAVHLFRLPFGVNTKPGRDGFAVNLVSTSTSVFYPIYVTPAAAPVSGPGPSGGTADISELRALMALIPNTFDDRETWIDIGHGLKALCDEDTDGFTVFDEWSATHASYDAAHTRSTWDSFGAGAGLLTKGGALRDRAEKSRAFAVQAFDDGAVPPALPPKSAVKFIVGKTKQILSMMENAKRAIMGLGLVCRYDEFHHRAFIERADGTPPARVDDKAVLMLRDEITAAYGKEFGLVHVGEAIMTLAYLNGFNPVVEMLAGAEALWDGVARLNRLGPDYFHTEKSRLAAACFRKVMIAAVRRARSPGCKFDQILVLESPEGWDKSTAWRVLAGDENFSDADILSKDAKAVQEELADIWIHEIADLAGLSRADVDHVKAFASRTNDRARPAYGRFLLDQPRQSIEVGTTNAETYLVSITGNRRFWTFKMDARVDIAALVRDRLQIWGEAAAAEAAGETLVLDEKLWGDAATAQEERRVVDPWEDELMNLPDMAIKDIGGGEEGISNVAIHNHLVGGHRGGHLAGAGGRKIAEIMKRLGWERARIMDAEGKQVRGYKRKTDGTDKTVFAKSSVFKNPF